MSARVSGIGMPDRLGMSAAVDLDGSHAPTKTGDLKSAEATKTKQMAQEFEAMFLRQILTSAKIGGASKSGGGGDGYQSMSVDAPRQHHQQERWHGARKADRRPGRPRRASHRHRRPDRPPQDLHLQMSFFSKCRSSFSPAHRSCGV